MPIANISVGNIYRLRVSNYCQNQLGLNVTYWVVSSAGGATPETTLVDPFDALLGPLYIACMSADANYIGCSIQRVFPTIGFKYISTVSAGPGTVDGNVSGKQLAYLIRWLGFTGGRNQRGRIYVPFVPANFCAISGEPTADADTAYTALAGGYGSTMTVGTGNTLDLIITKKGDPATYQPIQNTQISHHFATQRRRSDFNRTNPAAPE